jgi:hypothetical protein
MNLQPVFLRDLRGDRDFRRLRKDRLVIGAISGVILLVLVGVERWAGLNLAQAARIIPLAGVAPFLLLTVGVSVGTRLLATERREGTLFLLLLTRLSGHDILLSKLFVTLIAQWDVFLAAVPALTLPFLVLGYGLGELGLLTLACVNLLFAGLSLGLIMAVFLNEQQAVTVGLIVSLPLLASATPLIVLLPSSILPHALTVLQWLNPGEPLAHVQTVAAGFRKSAFWVPLLGSHLSAWALLVVGGALLPQACRWQAGFNAGPRVRGGIGRAWLRPRISRTRLLNRNPFFWLASRSVWPTLQIWAFLLSCPLLWGWLVWLTWARRGINVTIVFVVAMGASWVVTLLVAVPAEACRCLVEDKESGVLELVLGTPFQAPGIVRGQWLALVRRYAAPLLFVIVLSMALMLTGYVTFGFGGMLEPEDRPLWLIAWLSGLLLLPFSLATLCWVAMRRTLFARNVGEASGLALVQVVGVPCLVLTGLSLLSHSLLGWNPEGWPRVVISLFVYFGWLVVLARRARRILLRDLRCAATMRYAQAPLAGNLRN